MKLLRRIADASRPGFAFPTGYAEAGDDISRTGRDRRLLAVNQAERAASTPIVGERQPVPVSRALVTKHAGGRLAGGRFQRDRLGVQCEVSPCAAASKTATQDS